MRKTETQRTRDLKRVLELLYAWRDAKFAQLDAQDARFKAMREKHKASLRAENREFVFRLFHPIKAVQTWWKHKPAHGSLLHPLYEADQASVVKA